MTENLRVGCLSLSVRGDCGAQHVEDMHVILPEKDMERYGLFLRFRDAPVPLLGCRPNGIFHLVVSSMSLNFRGCGASVRCNY